MAQQTGYIAVKRRLISNLTRLALAVSVLLAFIAAPLVSPVADALAQEQPPPELIAGKLVPGTEGAVLPADQEIILITLDAAGHVVDQTPQEVAEDGSFDFTELPGDTTSRYQLYVEHGGIAWTINVADEPDPADVTIDVWETTESLDAVSITSYSAVFEQLQDQNGVLGVLELVTIRNNGDRTFIPDVNPGTGLMPQLLRFGLPEGYTDFTVESSLPSGQTFNTSAGYALEQAIPPGQYQIFASYLVPYEGTAFEYRLPFPLGAGTARFLMPLGLGKVSGFGLAPDENAVISGTTYTVVSGSSYPRNSELTVQVSGLPGESALASAFSARNLRVILPAAAGGIMALLLLTALFIRRKRSVAAAETS